MKKYLLNTRPTENSAYTGNQSILLGRPCTVVTGGLINARDVFFIFSTPNLRAPSTDRPETLPHGQNLAEFYNPTPKIRGAFPPKKLGAKNMQNSVDFCKIRL